MAQKAHPMQFCGFSASATKYPFAFMRCVLSAMTFLGQALAHSPHPLHSFSSMVMLAIITSVARTAGRAPLSADAAVKKMLSELFYHEGICLVKQFIAKTLKKVQKMIANYTIFVYYREEKAKSVDSFQILPEKAVYLPTTEPLHRTFCGALPELL